MKYLLNIIPILFLVSCSTTVPYLENGEKLYNNNMYHEALKVLNEGNKVNPNDVDIQIALKKAQDKVYELELLKIRDKRLSGDIFSALNMVREVDKKMTEWNIKSNLDGSQFRKQEISKLLSDMQKIIDISVNKGHIVKAHLELIKFKDILYSLDSFTEYENSIIKEGKNKCKTLQGDNDIYNIFVKRYCAYFNEKYEPEINLNAHKYNIGLIQVSDNTGVEYATYNILSDSNLYSANGENHLNIISKISFNYSENKSVINKNKSYTVDEPYWTTENETYWINEPYWTTEMKCTYTGTSQPCRNVRVQKTRTVPRSRPVKVKKYKEVKKNISYEADRITQFLLLSGRTELHINSNKVLITHKEQDSYFDDYHDFEDSRADIRPDNLIKKNVFEWKETLKNKVLLRVKEEVLFRLENTTCVESGNKKDYQNNVIKCGWLNKSSDFLENWSQKELGLDYKTVKEQLGF